MSKPAVEVVSQPALRPFGDVSDTGPVDVTIERLRLQGQLRSQGAAVNIARAITDTGSGQNQLTDSYTAPPQLTLNVVDEGYVALNSGIFDKPVEIDIDGVQMRLVKVSLIAPEILELLFYHKIIALLMTHKSPLSVARSKVTRAQFIEMMLREILDEFPDLIYVCPEVNQRQPVAAPRKTARSLTSKTLATNIKGAGKAPGFGVGSLRIQSWDGSQVTLGPEQLANAARVLDTCSQLAAPAKAVLAVCEACIVEPPNFTNPSGGTSDSAGILQVRASTAGPMGISNTDVVQCVTAFLQRGFYGHGGAIQQANSSPHETAGTIAQNTQGSAYGGRYDLAQAGAQTVINAYRSAGGLSLASTMASASMTATIATYNFTRGQSGHAEDSYTCAQRLAGEVNWRFFVTGRRTAYFVTDDDLIDLPSKYLLSPGNEGLGQVTFDLEVGNRTIVRAGKRIPRPSQGQVAARIARFGAQVGDTISLQGYGDADGKWVLYQVDRDIFDKTGTLYFQQAQNPFKEPAATTSTISAYGLTGGSLQSSNPIDRVYAAASAMSRRNLPYVYGGGHTGSWKTAVTAPGLDCSSSVSIVLYQAGLMHGYAGPIVSGDFASWGAAGRGRQMTVWCNSGHVFIQFYGRPAKRFDTVPGGSGGNGPHLRSTAPGDVSDTWEASGFQARHVPGY